jgi:hypothetical protein
MNPRLVALPLLFLATQAAAQSWTLLTPPPYPNTLQRRTGGIAFDPIQGKLLMYGGLQSTTPLNDTWTFDGATWTQLTPATTPPPRWGHRMVLDTRRMRIVTFGGRSPTATANANDTWEWNGVDWQQVVTANAPSARGFYGLAFDERRGKTVLFGGQLGGFIPSGGNETWEYDGVDWTRATPAFTMPGLESPAMAYDQGRGVVVMFGGWDTNVSPAVDHRETWEYDGVDWVLRPTANAPLTGYRTGMVYDQDRGRMVLYGGYSGGVQQNAWEFDGNDWTNVLPGGGPGRISEGFMAYNPVLQSTVYFGGSGPNVVGTVNNETWVYTGSTTAIAAKFGHGCATSAGVPDLAPTTAPRLGNSYVLTISNGALSGIGFLAHGFSNTTSAFGPLPADLGAVGYPGCRLEISPDATLLVVLAGGTSTQSIGVPNNALLTNLPLFSQAVVIDALAPNGNGGVTNAVHAVLGN